MKRAETLSYPISIFIAGNPTVARDYCSAHCDRVGLCVTVTPTEYVYTDGSEPGVIVGLINYPRFPAEPREIWFKAETLANELRLALEQESFTIQAPDKTVWFSWRASDLASVDGRRMAETPQSGSVRSATSAVAATSGETPNPGPSS